MTCPIALLLAASLCAQPAEPQPADPQAFRARCAELARASERTHHVVEGAGGELFLQRQLVALGTGRFWGEDAPKTRKGRRVDPLAAIVDFKAKLEALGVELLVVPVPSKALVHPELLPRAAPIQEPLGRLDSVEAQFLAALREKGVAVLDLLPVLLERRGGPTDFCKTDHHLNGRGQVLLAQLIAKAIEDRPWLAAAREGAPALQTEWKDTRVEGALAWMRATADKVAPETVALRFVRDGATRRPPAEARDAPVLLMGDSCVLVFHAGANTAVPTASMHGVGAGLMEQLAAELRVPVDVAGTLLDGVDAPRLTLRQREKARPGYLAGKKLAVWVFFEDALTQVRDGWRELPLP